MTLEQQSVDERIAEIEARALTHPEIRYDDIAWLIAELRSARKDSERLDWCLAQRAFTVTTGMPIRDNYFGDRDELDSVMDPVAWKASLAVHHAKQSVGSVLPEQER